MANPLIQKLEYAGGLGEADRAALAAISAVTRRVEAHRDLSREGDRPETVHLVMEGFAYRYKILPGGKRQILGLLLPGDFCDLHVAILAERDHSVATFAPSRIAEISHLQAKARRDRRKTLGLRKSGATPRAGARRRLDRDRSAEER